MERCRSQKKDVENCLRNGLSVGELMEKARKNVDKKKKDVRKLVEDWVKFYRQKDPSLPRDFLREHIRFKLKDRNILFTDAVERRLDRILAAAYKTEQSSQPSPSASTVPELSTSDPNSRNEAEEVYSVVIPNERLQQVAEKLLEKMPLITPSGAEKADEDLEKHPIVDREGKEHVGYFIALAAANSMDEKEKLSVSLLKVVERIKIGIASEAGETAPTLTDEDIAPYIRTVIRNSIDLNTGQLRRPFKIIISFSPDAQNLPQN